LAVLVNILAEVAKVTPGERDDQVIAELREVIDMLRNPPEMVDQPPAP
jgi:hypothetical protein